MSTTSKTIEYRSNPFPGLRPFKYEEKHLYFGRESQVNEVLTKLMENHFVSIVGISGIGKSSFLYCGILPILLENFSSEFTTDWNVYTVTPGTSPIRNLAQVLSEGGMKTLPGEEMDFETCHDRLQQGNDALIDIFKDGKANDTRNHLIFIDQFEEIFRFQDPEEATSDEVQKFVELLVTASKQSEVPIYIALTMRSDFVGSCSQYPNLTDLINDSQFLIPYMTREEKREAILGPVNVMEGQIEEELVNRLLDDVGNNPDQLPIMQHVLMRTWDYWKMHDPESMQGMSLRHYTAIGGMDSALSVHANEAYSELDNFQKKNCEKLFKTITGISSEGKRVRRPSSLKEIATIADASMDEMMEVINAFRRADRGLIMPGEETGLQEDTMIDISHESLIRIWETLREWVEEEAESAKLYLRLAEAAEMYQEGKSSLWTPPDLDIALSWKNEQKPSLEWGLRYHPTYERTMLFLEYSEKEYKKEQVNKEKLRKRRLKIANIIAGVLTVGLIIALGTAFFAFEAKKQANEEKKKAEKQRVRAEGESKRAEKESENAKEQAKRAEKEKKEAEKQKAFAVAQKARAEQAFRKATSEEEKARQAATIARKAAEIANLNKEIAEIDRRLADLAREESEVARQDAEKANKKARNLRLLDIARSMAIKSLQLPDSTQGLVAQQAYIFNRDNGGRVHDPDIYDGLYYAVKTIKGDNYNQLYGHWSNVRSIIAANGQSYIYSAGSDGQVIRWNTQIEGGNPVVIAQDSGRIQRTLAISANNKYLASAGEYRYINIFDLTKPKAKAKRLELDTKEIWYLAFTPDNKGLISLDVAKRVSYWDISTGNQKILSKNNFRINSIDMNIQRNIIALAKTNGEISFLNRSTGAESVFFQDTRGVDFTFLAFSYDGNYLAAGDRNGLVRLWNLNTHEMTALAGHKARVNNICFNKGGTQLATGSWDKTVRIWNMKKLADPAIVLKDHHDWVWSIKFSEDGKKLFAGCKDNLVRVWPTSAESMANIICTQTKRNLSSNEWNYFVGEDITYQRTCSHLSKGRGVKKEKQNK